MKIKVNKLIKCTYYVVMHIVQKTVGSDHFLLGTCCEEALCFTDKEAGAQRNSVICPRSLSQHFNSGNQTRAHTFNRFALLPLINCGP